MWARAGVTSKYGESGPVGLVTGKKVYIFMASGGVYSQGPAAAMDQAGTYLRSVLVFIGLTGVTTVHSEGLAMGEGGVEKGRRWHKQATSSTNCCRPDILRLWKEKRSRAKRGRALRFAGLIDIVLP
jgi:FMN-dependent NADH-azoreductase